VNVPSKRKGKRARAPRLSLSQTSAGVGSAKRIGSAAKLKPRKPLAPSPKKNLGGRPVVAEEGEQAPEEGGRQGGGGEAGNVAGWTAEEGDGEPGGGGGSW